MIGKKFAAAIRRDDATLAVRVAAEQVAYWRGCGLRIADMWDAIEYRHHGGERELLIVLAERWVDCRRWLAGAAAGINADVAA